MPRIDRIIIDTILKLIGQFQDFIPKFIGGIIVFLIGLLIAKGIAFIIVKAFKNIGIDKLGDKLNDLDFVKKFKLNIVLSQIISKIVYYFIIMIFLSTATETLGFKVITDLVANMVNMVPRIIAAMILLLVGLLLADVIQKAVVSACRSLNIASAKLIGSIVFFFFLAITVIASLGQAGINTSLLESSFNLIVAGIIFAFAFGYGFASKDVLANIISSFYSKNNLKIGQVIELDGKKGSIISIDNTFITLQIAENLKVQIPISSLQTNNVTIHD
jgi:small-conductance mechanosensitive channel